MAVFTVVDGTKFNVYAPSQVGRWRRLETAPDESVDNAEPPYQEESKPKKRIKLDSVTESTSTSIATTTTTAANTAKSDDNENRDFQNETEDTSKKNPNGSTKKKPFLATRLIASDPQVEHPSLLYDKVLVDAECTHDGSIAHLKKCDRTGWERFEANFFDPVYMDDLEVLQVSACFFFYSNYF
jgi:hypothetical protein